jgi:hypothetical protein
VRGNDRFGAGVLEAPGYAHKIPHLRNFLPGLALRVTRLPVERKLSLHVAHRVHGAHKTVDVSPTPVVAVYSTCEIHGAMNPHERKKAQGEFRTYTLRRPPEADGRSQPG